MSAKLQFTGRHISAMAFALTEDRTSEYRWIRWIPLLALPIGVLTLQDRLPAWGFMWLMVLAIFEGFKFVTWFDALDQTPKVNVGRSIAYLIATPSMNAKAFMSSPVSRPPRLLDWFTAGLSFCVGCAVLWGGVRVAYSWSALFAGWVGLAGIALALHFGLLHLWSLVWKEFGFESPHIMNAPLRATSVSDFWGNRWNLAFNDVVYHLVFRKLLRKIGLRGSLVIVFIISGVLHELVISLPAQAGFGLPTVYFGIQAGGALAERSSVGKRLRIGYSLRGWLWTALIVGGPAYWLFHPEFIREVMLPMLDSMGCL